MPIVKMRWIKAIQKKEDYLLKDRGSEPVVTASDGLDMMMSEQINAEVEKHGSKVENKALEITQAWPVEESTLLTPEKYNEMGHELAKQYAPGHKAWVITHTEKDHIHNHIVICNVHSETGKALTNKRSEMFRLHEVNNEIARENGFKLVTFRGKEERLLAPERAKAAAAQGKKTWFFDLQQKVDFARAVSTSFDEYTGILKFLGVHARVENKNVSYVYGEDTKAIRSKRLGKKFDKEGLKKAFEVNDERYKNNPGLRAQSLSDLRSAFDGKGNFVGTQSHLLLESTSYPGFGKKDYGQFTKIARNSARDELPAIFDRSGGVLYHEMKKASEVSIFEYCKANNIKLKTNEKGQTVLQGLDFVILNEKSWTNHKNGRQGTIIDFVKIYKDTTEIGAVAEINKNPRLLVLEKYIGEYKAGIKSFYFPKPKSAMPDVAAKTMQSLLKSRGMEPSHAEAMLKSKQLHVGQDKSVWFSSERGDAAIEFREDNDGKWKSKRHGNPAGIFLEANTKSKHAVILRDPFEFALFKAKGGLPGHSDANILVMFGDGGSDQKIDEMLALHEHIHHVHLAHMMTNEGSQRLQERSQSLAKRFNPFDVHIKELRLSDLGKDRSYGPEIGL